MLAILPSYAGGQTRVELHRECYQKLVAFRRCLAPSAMVSADVSNLAELGRGTDTSRTASRMLSKASSLSQVPGT
jgi:hypothetical protein